MPRRNKDSAYTYRSSIWDQSLLLTVCTIFAGGLIYGLNYLLHEDQYEDENVASGGSADGGGDGDGDGD
jgi:hypothetical protein